MPTRHLTEHSESNEFRVALEALQNQITTRFPTREDIKTALDALQMQLEHRFAASKDIYDTKLDERDRRYSAEVSERDKAIDILEGSITRRISTIDLSLREHLASQVKQIEMALSAADKLEVGRIQTVHEKTDAVIAEMGTINNASEKAIAKAEASVEKRFDTYDKAVQALRDLVNNAMPRAEVITLVKASTDKIGDLTDRINRTEGKGAGMGQIWGYIVGAGGVIVAMVALFGWLGTLSPKVDKNSERIVEELIRRQHAAPTP